MSDEERHKRSSTSGPMRTTRSASAMLDATSTSDNPIYMMADSGARGNIKQLRQLAGMRGLMADTKGETIDLPIKSNFREGLSVAGVLHFHATALERAWSTRRSHTADSGYLTRRLVDVAQDVIVREERLRHRTRAFPTRSSTRRATSTTDLVGRCVLEDVVDPDGTVLVERRRLHRLDGPLTRDGSLRASRRSSSARSSPATAEHGVCQKCYGWDLCHRASGQHRHRGRHHRRPVHRRAGYAAYDAYHSTPAASRASRTSRRACPTVAACSTSSASQREDSGPRGRAGPVLRHLSHQAREGRVRPDAHRLRGSHPCHSTSVASPRRCALCPRSRTAARCAPATSSPRASSTSATCAS